MQKTSTYVSESVFQVFLDLSKTLALLFTIEDNIFMTKLIKVHMHIFWVATLYFCIRPNLFVFFTVLVGIEKIFTFKKLR